MDLPYRAEYSKSARASCRSCKSPIAKEVLRLAVMVQSRHFDGKSPNWYHAKCFFIKQRPKTVDDIENFENLRHTDQDTIKSNVEACSGAVVPTKKGKKRKNDPSTSQSLGDFQIEYSKSGRAGCRGCEQKILKDEIRISKKDYESDIGKRYGGEAKWYHVTCFAKLRSELAYFESGDKLPGAKSLSKDDLGAVKRELPAIKQEEVSDVKKVKVEKDDDVDAKIKEQSKILYKYRDQLKAAFKKKELVELLEYNEQYVPPGEDAILDRLADVMTFGAFVPCSECQDGYYVYTKLGYQCHGNLTEWTKCNLLTKEPKRCAFRVPTEIAEEVSFLRKYKYTKRSRVFKDVNPTNGSAVKKEDEVDGPKVTRERPALYEMEFVLALPRGAKNREALKKKITTLGGKVVAKAKSTVMAVISTKSEVEKMGSRMEEAESEQIQVVPADFLDEAETNKGKIPDLIIKKSICNWGTDPTKRLPDEATTSSKSKSRSIFTKSVPKSVTLKLKGGSAVDPDSNLDHVAHIYQDGADKYNAILGVTDIQRQRNSYYKLQLLQGDKSDRYWVFRAWGRIGTTIGGNKTQEMDTLRDAKHAFEELYEEKTGNMWSQRANFVKIPGRMYPIDVDYDSEEQESKLDIVETESKLVKPVQDLIRLIFDVQSMKKLMLEFELDTEKMPLGKLSKKQLQSAYGVLTELMNLIASNGNDSRFIDASNRFYTYVPHSFGVDEVPVIKDADTVKQKIDMLDNLMELEIAYNLMKSSGGEHTVDSYYKQLNTEIGSLDRTSEEFRIIEEYVKNTHAATHSSYGLEIEEVYTVERQGETRRFKPYKKLHNKKLLWHGSRVTNFAGILSQGLRIAPPEAPVTGYMFGKGIYFADMVSKSANYCCTNAMDSTGLLLLCEVALGDMYERMESEYVEKLPKGKHSTKGVGRTEPDPKASKELNGVEVPVGVGVELPGRKKSSLLYNEYIVYDVAQVNVKYLLKLNFKYKF